MIYLDHRVTTRLALPSTSGENRLAFQIRRWLARIHCTQRIEHLLAEARKALASMHHAVWARLGQLLQEFAADLRLSREVVDVAVVVVQALQGVHPVLADLWTDSVTVQVRARCRYVPGVPVTRCQATTVEFPLVEARALAILLRHNS